MTEQRLIQVPEGIAGVRADSGIAKLLGLSRASVAEIIESGLVLQNNIEISKSDLLLRDAWLQITLPKPKPPLEVVAELVPDLKIVHLDKDIVVEDKPEGVAAHPSVGWSGPTVGGAHLPLV